MRDIPFHVIDMSCAHCVRGCPVRMYAHVCHLTAAPLFTLPFHFLSHPEPSQKMVVEVNSLPRITLCLPAGHRAFFLAPQGTLAPAVSVDAKPETSALFLVRVAVCLALVVVASPSWSLPELFAGTSATWESRGHHHLGVTGTSVACRLWVRAGASAPLSCTRVPAPLPAAWVSSHMRDIGPPLVV